VLEGLFGRRALLGIVGKKLGNQALCLIRNVVPARVREGELAHSNLLHDLLIARPIEGWHTREDDIEDDTARPDITLLVVLLVEDLGGNVVGGAQLLIEGLVCVKAKRCAKIDDLDLIEIFVLLQ
jgi:hypothetical protein